MAYLEPRYKYDVFVSYAHVDNETDPGVERGWVTNLLSSLENRVARRLRPRPEFWRDYKLAHNKPLTPEIVDTLEASATLLLILSPAYMASEWCQFENKRFWQAVEHEFRPESRVFLVEHNKLDEGIKPPPQCRDLVPYRFWVKEPDRKTPRILGDPAPLPDEPEGRRYYVLLDDLGHDLARELKRLKGGQPKGKPEKASTVFLAEVSHDLVYKRDEVKRYLQQADLRCLPETRYSYDESDRFQRQLEKDLKKCSRFVQLLSEFPGRRGYLRLQYERAKAAGLPIFQWHRPELNPLDPETVKDEDLREMLRLETVRAVGIEDFKRAVKDWQPPEPKKQISAFVFVNSDRPDKKLAEQVCKALKSLGAGYVLPLPLVQLKPPPSVSATRKDLEDRLQECDALIIIYGETEVGWVRRQIAQCNRALSKREEPLRTLGLYEGPPAEPPKSDPGIELPNLEILTIDCTHGLDEEALRAFLGSVR